MDINRCVFIGRITKDVELRYNGDKPVCRFQIANSRGKNKDPNWISLVLWYNADKLHPYLKKGTQVAVDCRLEQYTKQNGNYTNTITEFVVERLELIGSNPNQQNSQSNNYSDQEPIDPNDPFDSDSPF